MPATKKPSRKASSIPRKSSKSKKYVPYTPIDFSDVEKRAHELADQIEQNYEALAHVLLEYESYEVVHDEVTRTLDLLRNIRENREYFPMRVGQVTAFLPRNQPLYALSCFVIIPSLMASEVHFRIPNSMRHFFPKLLALLNIYKEFPNIIVSHKERSEFLTERSALKHDPASGDTLPVTDAVIFTGTSIHAEQLRFVFDERTLFISNGSGHNPLVVSSDANLPKAVAATITLQLYNQGQDCAAPNAVLVHKDIFTSFLSLIRDELRTVGVGHYSNRSCRVGPISDPKDLVRIQDFLIRNRKWLDATTPGVTRAADAILEPTIITKPLSEGGNYSEIFAPVIFLQQYSSEEELAQYFENKSYALNAMYVTLYGTSKYIQELIRRSAKKGGIHPKDTFLHNTHLHAPGKERGTEPYGGYGLGASSLSIHGQTIAKPTLPQRDIFEWIATPLLKSDKSLQISKDLKRFSKILEKDIQKLLRLKASDAPDAESKATSITYIDTQTLKKESFRYIKLKEDVSFHLLASPNLEYINKLRPHRIDNIRKLNELIKRRDSFNLEEFKTGLYAIPVTTGMSTAKKKEAQLQFFQDAYELIFGEKSGPRLAQFLIEVDPAEVCVLLDI